MYWFLDSSDQVLYVGKAKNLKNRLTQYTQLNRLIERTRQLVTTAAQLKYQVLNSELEALLTEAELIRTYQPKYNILLKDDKSPIYILITKEKFPRVLTIRKPNKSQAGTILGPFQSSYKVKEVLKIARRIFPWCHRAELDKPCFYYHLKLCPGACVGEISSADYQAQTKQLVLFLRGQKTDVIKNLKLELKNFSQNEQYEKAAQTRDKIQLIEAVTKSNFKLTPELILPGLKQQTAQNALLQLKRILHLTIGLPQAYQLKRIEGYDVSNVSGTDAAVSMVTFINGEKNTADYRVFNIYSLDTPNDYLMLKEALLRRQSHNEWGMPEIVLIDGGKGQVKSVLKVWRWPSLVVGLAKNPDRLIIPQLNNLAFLSINPNLSYDDRPARQLKGLTWHEIKLDPKHPVWQLLAQIRDEAHRFAQKQHHRRHLRSVINVSS